MKCTNDKKKTMLRSIFCYMSTILLTLWGTVAMALDRDVQISIIRCAVPEIRQYMEMTDEAGRAEIFLTAVSMCNATTIRALKQLEYKSAWRLSDGSNVLHAAAYNKLNADIIDIFASETALASQKNSAGKTPEDFARQVGNSDFVARYTAIFPETANP
jgi:hypothetical protein